MAEDNDPENGEIQTGTRNASSHKSNRPVSQQEREVIKKGLTDSNGAVTEIQKDSIRKGFIHLRMRYMNEKKELVNPELKAILEPKVSQMIDKINHGINRTEAESILVEIRNLMAA